MTALSASNLPPDPKETTRDSLLGLSGPHNLLAVALDDLTLGRLRAAARGTGLQIVPISAGEALRRAAEQNAPFLVLIEWNAVEAEERTRFCQALRSVSGRDLCSVVAVGGLSDQGALAAALETGADEVLSRPFSGDLVLRLARLLKQRSQSPGSASPRHALEEALAAGGGGEVVVRAGDITGIIHVQDQHIIWAHVSSLPASLEEVLRLAGVQLDSDTVEAVKQDCRANDKNFVDVLVHWRVLEEAQAHEAVRAFVAGRVEHILKLDGATALFLPKTRRRVERIRFRASEIPSLMERGAALPGPMELDMFADAIQRPSFLGMEHVFGVVRAAMKADGCVGAAVLDRGTCASLLQEGEDPDTAVAWSHLMTLAALGPEAEDVIATTSSRCFVTRALAGTESLALFVAFSTKTTTVGLARASVAQVVSPR